MLCNLIFYFFCVRQVMSGTRMRRKKKTGDSAHRKDTPTQWKTKARQAGSNASARWARGMCARDVRVAYVQRRLRASSEKEMSAYGRSSS